MCAVKFGTGSAENTKTRSRISLCIFNSITSCAVRSFFPVFTYIPFPPMAAPTYVVGFMGMLLKRLLS